MTYFYTSHDLSNSSKDDLHYSKQFCGQKKMEDYAFPVPGIQAPYRSFEWTANKKPDERIKVMVVPLSSEILSRKNASWWAARFGWTLRAGGARRCRARADKKMWMIRKWLGSAMLSGPMRGQLSMRPAMEKLSWVGWYVGIVRKGGVYGVLKGSQINIRCVQGWSQPRILGTLKLLFL